MWSYLKNYFTCPTHVPTVKQTQATECGVAALAMLLAYHNRYVPLEELRKATGVSRDGTSATILIKAARKYGIHLKAVRCEPDKLSAKGLPLIVHMYFNHFVIVEEIDDRWVRLNDPCFGPQLMSIEEFDTKFTGIALVGTGLPDHPYTRIYPALASQLKERLTPFKWQLIRVGMSGITAAGFLTLAILQLQTCIDLLINPDHSAKTMDSAVLAVGFAVLSWIFTWYEKTSAAKLEFVMAGETKSRLLNHLIHLPYAFFSYRMTGYLHSILNSCHSFSNLVLAITITFVAGASCLFPLLAGIHYSSLITGLIFLVSLINLAIVTLTNRRADIISPKQAAGSNLTGYAADTIERIEVLKTGGMDVEFLSDITGNHAYSQSRFHKRLRFDQIEAIAKTSLHSFNLVVVLLVGGSLWNSGDLSIGSVVALWLISIWIFDNLSGLGSLHRKVEQLRHNIMTQDDIFDYDKDDNSTVNKHLQESSQFAISPSIYEYPESGVNDEENSLSGDVLKCENPDMGIVALDNISFGYSHKRSATIPNLSLSISKDEILGITGPSASGKSTIGGLIAGLHRPWSGSVRIEGQPITSIPTGELAATICLIDKNPFLFSGTIRENLTMWDEDIPDEDLWQAVGDACLKDVVMQRGQGLDSWVAERGINFSVGQQQRLEIARALTRKPKIVILDEANDALEIELEKQIITNMRRRGCTIILISHRDATLKRCDRIVTVEGGRICNSLIELDRFSDNKPCMIIAESGGDGVSNVKEINAMSREAPESSDSGRHNLVGAFSRVARAMGLKVNSRSLDSIYTGQLGIYQLASHHHLLVRRIRMIERDWWENDCGALIGFLGDDERPVALLPECAGSYRIIDPHCNEEQSLTPAMATKLKPTTYMLYQRCPDQSMPIGEFLKMAFSGGLGDGLLSLATGLVIAGCSLAWPSAAMLLFSRSQHSNMTGTLTLGLISMIICQGMFQYLEIITRHRLIGRGLHTAIAMIWDRVVRLPVPFIRHKRAERLGQQAGSINLLFSNLDGTAENFINALPFIPFTAILLWIDVRIAIFGLIFVSAQVLFSVIFTTLINHLEVKRFDHTVLCNAFMFNLLQGVRKLRSTAAEQSGFKKWEWYAANQRRSSWHSQIAEIILDVCLKTRIPIAAIGLAAVVILSQSTIMPGIDSARMMAIALALTGLIMAAQSFANMISQSMQCRPSISRLKEILNQPCESVWLNSNRNLISPSKKMNIGAANDRSNHEYNQTRGARTIEPNGEIYTSPPRGEIELREVGFRYNKDAAPVLEYISLKIDPGQIVVIEGTSGSGKSTLLRLILGFYSAESGGIYFDGVPLERWNLDVLRSQIGSVLQEDSLWDGIVRNNIAGRTPYSVDKIWDVLHLVELAVDVERMPLGINTFTGSLTLSTGQKQRLIMARHLIRRPRLLILDEATSALDNAMEARLFAKLRSLSITCICVAHRESTVNQADKVYRLRNGRLVG